MSRRTELAKFLKPKVKPLRPPKAIYILDRQAFEKIYANGPDARIAEQLDIVAPPQTAEEVRADPQRLEGVQIILSGWGGPRLDERLLEAMPALRIIFYGGGTIRNVMTPAAWQRGIRITSAYAANAVPVAEFTVAQIIFCLKLGWQHLQAMKCRRVDHLPVPGAYNSTVGIISLGQIGRRVCRMLQAYDVNVMVFDPYVSPQDAQRLNVTMVPTLDEIFSRCDVVSLHTPWLPETEGMIDARLLRMLKPYASFINTARGALVDQDGLTTVLRERIDLVAVLDVTHPEPLERDSILWDLPNAVLLPHIAGSMDGECHRMGQTIVEEVQRYLTGQPLQWEIQQAIAHTLA